MISDYQMNRYSQADMLLTLLDLYLAGFQRSGEGLLVAVGDSTGGFVANFVQEVMKGQLPLSV
jgi:hypothetical protein